MRALIGQFARFGVVGVVGLIVNVSLFNLLYVTVFDHANNGPFYAELIATTVAIIVNWLGNRYWTFRHQRRSHWLREGIEFALVSIGGLIIVEGCLLFSEDVLDLHTQFADNIATNVVGLALGTIFRFVFYRLWVFGPAPALIESDSASAANPSGDAGRSSQRIHEPPRAAAENIVEN